jgi:hypothetical protein
MRTLASGWVVLILIAVGGGCSSTIGVARTPSESALKVICGLYPDETLEVFADDDRTSQPIKGYLVGQPGPAETQLRTIPEDHLLMVNNQGIRRIRRVQLRTGAMAGALLGLVGGSIVGGTVAALTYSDPDRDPMVDRFLHFDRSERAVIVGIFSGILSTAFGALVGSQLHFTNDYVFGPTVTVEANLGALAPVNSSAR